MKFELLYVQEQNALPLPEAQQLAYVKSFLDKPSLVCPVRVRRTWNVASFGVEGYPASVCSGFALASIALYSGELYRAAKRLSTFTGTIAWPRLDTIDRRYFGNILSGVIRSADIGCSSLSLVNSDEFFAGLEQPFFFMNVDRVLCVSLKRPVRSHERATRL